MNIIEPHIHMYSRTTDDYTAMYRAGIRVAIEPSFWMGTNRRYAGSFYDYFSLILDFETERAKRFGIDHYACISVNPKEADDLALAKETLSGMGEYLDHERCLAVGEIGFNLMTKNEETIFQAQLEMAVERDMLILIHTPHDTPQISKRKGLERILDIIRELDYDPGRIIVDHNTEDTMDLTRKTDVWAGMTVYPYSKLNPERVVDLVKTWGLERMLVNSSADWGVSDPCSLPHVAEFMAARDFSGEDIKQLLFDNPENFYRQTPRFKPRLDLPYIEPATYQR